MLPYPEQKTHRFGGENKGAKRRDTKGRRQQQCHSLWIRSREVATALPRLFFMVGRWVHLLLSQQISFFIQNCKISCKSVDTNCPYNHLMEIFSPPLGGCYHFNSSHLTLILKAHSPSFIWPTVAPYLLSDQMQPSEPDGKGLRKCQQILNDFLPCPCHYALFNSHQNLGLCEN